MRPTRLRIALIAAVQVAWLAAPHDALSREAPNDPTIVVEAEAALVGGQVAVGQGPDASGGAFLQFSGPAQPPPPGGIRVAGNRLLRDGAPFVPVGFSMVGLVHPTAEGGTAWAAKRVNDRTMQEALAWGANIIRFQVSQRGLDPTDVLFSQAYLDRITAGVALARAHGLAVILSIQDQEPSGGNSHAQPSEATVRDWQTLTSLFNGDQHVMYEIFNEPQNRPTPEGWEVWRNGGPPEGNQGTAAVGHQRVLEAIRATGSTNVVIADAGQFGQRLDGVPLLHDPRGQVAYGVHPYLTHTLRFPQDWEPGFGFLRTQYPVIVTEWSAVSFVRFCKPEWATTAPLLVDYLRRNHIGMLAWSLDVIDSLIADGEFTPTSLEYFRCGEEHGHGAGELVKSQMSRWAPEISPCETGLTDAGAVAVSVDVPSTREYRLWSRVMKGKKGEGSGIGFIQVDDGCPIQAWDAVSPDGRWSWESARSALMTLGAGRHTIRFLGASGGVNLDRIVLTADEDCVPAHPGHDCEG